MRNPLRLPRWLGLRKRRVARADPELVAGLLRLSSKLAAESSFELRMDALCEATRDLIGCDRCSIFLLEDGLYRGRFNAGNPPDIALVFPDCVISKKDLLVQRAMTTRRRVAINDTRRSPLMNPETARVARIHSIVLAPIFDGRRESRGFMTAEFNERQESFEENESELFDGISKMIALAIDDHETQQALEQARNALQTQARLVSIGSLAAGFAHQINNPIGSILLSAEFALLAKGEPDELATAHASLETIREKAIHSGQILSSLMGFSRDEALAKWSCDLVEVAANAIKLVGDYALRHKATIRFEKGSAQLPVMMNPVAIEQALVNVLRNAIESKDSGAEVIIRIDRQASRVRLEILDDGRGIPEASLPKVLEAFFTTRLEDGGSGLGLNLAHRIITEHEGAIEVARGPDSGTLVRIDFPICEEPCD